ncbi:DUF6907 domain-containing protein [Streptomyces sp. NPDC059063]|uniref:DUF6907 domain-containing protein n=1 Tax=unclassified Streptomyces TaxID=2593676 RepID=UPI0036B2FEC2
MLDAVAEDNSSDRQVAIEDVWHEGQYLDLEPPHRDSTELLAYFRLAVDPFSDEEERRRSFVLGEGGKNAAGRSMSADDVEALCAQAEAAIAELHGLARRAHEADEAAPAI